MSTSTKELKEKSKAKSSLNNNLRKEIKLNFLNKMLTAKQKILLEKIKTRTAAGSILILGSGPSGGREGRGKDKRLETSALISTDNKNILINATHFLEEQIDKYKIKRIDAVLLGHGHSDIISGLPELFRFAGNKKIPAYALKETFDAIHREYKREYVIENKVESYKKFEIEDLEIIPVAVVHDEVRPDEFPAVAWHITFLNSKELIWCEDFNVGKLTERSEKYFKNNDLAILDCARLETEMIGHNSLTQLIPYIKRWSNKKTYLIQIGKDAPHGKIIQKLRERDLYPEVEPAWDGLRIYI